MRASDRGDWRLFWLASSVPVRLDQEALRPLLDSRSI